MRIFSLPTSHFYSIMRIPDEQKICIRNFPAGVSEEEVKGFFSSCGEVIDIYLKDNGSDTFGFVGFETRESQQQALEFDGREMNGTTIKVEAKRIQGGARGDSRDMHKVFVGGLTAEIPDEEIRSYFEKNVGPVNDFYRSARAGVFAFVGFTSEADKNAAVAKSGETVAGCTLRVEAKGSRPGPRGGAGYGGDYGAPSRRYSSPSRRRYRDEDEEPRYRRRVSRSPSPRSRRPAYRSRSPARRRYDSPSRSPPRHRRESRSPARNRRHRSRS